MRLMPGESAATQKVRVTPYPSTHLESLRLTFQKKYPQSFQAFCFLIEAEGLRIGHSADIGAPEDLAPLLKQPLDLLVCELAHFRPADLFNYLQGRKVKKIVFIHLGRRCWDKLEETRLLAEKMLPDVSITFARDGQEITL